MAAKRKHACQCGHAQGVHLWALGLCLRGQCQCAEFAPRPTKQALASRGQSVAEVTATERR
jgi:hypothetical protein